MDKFKSQLLPIKKRRLISSKICLSQTDKTRTLPARMKVFIENSFMQSAGINIGDVIDIMYDKETDTWALNKASLTGMKVVKLSNVTSGFVYAIKPGGKCFFEAGFYSVDNNSISINGDLITFKINSD
ncbi:hypothetical protein [Morganella morganii]|uniref:hypothetical protein n=1 Tax=Morganella morganii TaxID=582 RepID=UPI003AAB10C0